MGQAIAAIVVGEGVGPAQPLFFGGPERKEGVAFYLQIGQHLGVEHHRDRARGVVVCAFVRATAGWAAGWSDVHVAAHALDAGIVAAVLPRDDVQRLRLRGVEVVGDAEHVGAVTKALKVALEVGRATLVGRVAGTHPSVVVASTLGGRSSVDHGVAGDVIHLLEPFLAVDDGCPVLNGQGEHRLPTVLVVDRQFHRLGVRRGEQVEGQAVALHRHGAVQIHRSVHEQKDVVGGGRKAEALADEQQVMPLAKADGGFGGGEPVDGQGRVGVDDLFLRGAADAARHWSQHHEGHEQQCGTHLRQHHALVECPVPKDFAMSSGRPMTSRQGVDTPGQHASGYGEVVII